MQRPAQMSWQALEPGSGAPAVSDTGPRWLAWFLAASLATLILPVLVADVPPLLDYPNHLVRLWLISGGVDTPPLSQMYAVSWGTAHTNVGIDYVGAVIGRVIPAAALGSGLVLLALVLPPLGAIALNRVVFGGAHWWQTGFAFFACNATLLGGFLNFHIGLGLALLGAALEPRLAASALGSPSPACWSSSTSSRSSSTALCWQVSPSVAICRGSTAWRRASPGPPWPRPRPRPLQSFSSRSPHGCRARTLIRRAMHPCGTSRCLPRPIRC